MFVCVRVVRVWWLALEAVFEVGFVIVEALGEAGQVASDDDGKFGLLTLSAVERGTNLQHHLPACLLAVHCASLVSLHARASLCAWIGALVVALQS